MSPGYTSTGLRPGSHQAILAPMVSTTQYDGLFIATPERVSFAYQLAGLGSRSVAQLLDLLILSVAMIAVFVGIVAGRLCAHGRDPDLRDLLLPGHQWLLPLLRGAVVGADAGQARDAAASGERGRSAGHLRAVADPQPRPQLRLHSVRVRG